MPRPRQRTRPPQSATGHHEAIECDRLDELFHAVQGLGAKLEEIHGEISGRCKEWYSVEEVAGLTHRSAYTVRRWISEGMIKATRVPGTGPKGRLLAPREELKKLVDLGLGERIPSVTVR